VIDKDALDRLYERYNNARFIHPDPLEFLYDYDDIREREVAGLVAASLAYGQVKQILKSVSSVLKKLGPKPSEYIICAGNRRLEKDFSGFRHRFTTGAEVSSFLKNTGKVIAKYGSLNQCFISCMEKVKGENGKLHWQGEIGRKHELGRKDNLGRRIKKDKQDGRQYLDKQNKKYTGLPDIHAALMVFIKELRFGECRAYNSLIPIPDGKCAYKRMNLYLRWMVRRDNVDPGGWIGFSPSELIVPLDVHMHRVSLSYGFTSRKQADMKTALEVTESLRKYDPKDPVKYDFALTRAGIYIRNKPGA